MKRSILIILFCVAAFCATTRASDSTSRPYKPRPRLGMTEAEVVSRYGEPYHRVITEGRAVWYYRLKFGEVYGKEFVPFQYDSDNVYLGVINFDANGRIHSLVWNHSSAK